MPSIRRHGLRTAQWITIGIGATILILFVLFPPVQEPGGLLSDYIGYRWFRDPLISADYELRPLPRIQWERIIFVAAVTVIAMLLAGRRMPNREQRAELWFAVLVAIGGCVIHGIVIPLSLLSPFGLENLLLWLDVLAVGTLVALIWRR